MAACTKSLEQRISELEGKYAGEPGIVVCAGPSLRTVPDEWLTSFANAFCVNAAYRWYQQQGAPMPQYSVSVDGCFWQFHPDAKDVFPEERRFWLEGAQLRQHYCWPIITDYRLQHAQGIICDGSSAHAALHLALIAECSPIYLVGADQQLGVNGEVYAMADEKPHLAPETHELGFQGMGAGFQKLAELTEWGRIIDCSIEGKLTCFKKGQPWKNS